MAMDPEFYTQPFRREIARLRKVLSESPCYLIVRATDDVWSLVGYGDRVLALETERLRKALEDIAHGKVPPNQAMAYADAVLERRDR
jgi:hypothetical protein